MALDPSDKRSTFWADTKSDVKWAVALLFVLTLGLAAYVGWTQWNKPPLAEEDLPEITTLIFAQDGLVVPFEILSVLLLAALIAGVVIAFRDPEGEA